MEIVYKAKDGKVFNDEDECISYERILDVGEVSNDDIILIDMNGDRRDLDFIYNNIDDILIVKCKTLEAIALFDKISDDCMCESPYENKNPNMCLNKTYTYSCGLSEWGGCFNCHDENLLLEHIRTLQNAGIDVVSEFKEFIKENKNVS